MPRIGGLDVNEAQWLGQLEAGFWACLCKHSIEEIRFVTQALSERIMALWKLF